MQAQEDLLTVAPHLQLVNELHAEYFRRTALACPDDLSCQDLYGLLYDDMQSHPHIYFNVIFEMNAIYAERCAGMLCCLARIVLLRAKDNHHNVTKTSKSNVNKHNTTTTTITNSNSSNSNNNNNNNNNNATQQQLQEWLGSILEMTGKILHKYQQQCLPFSKTGSSNGSHGHVHDHRRPHYMNRRIRCRAQEQNCKSLVYQFHSVCVQAYAHMNFPNSAVTALREACYYEYDRHWDFQQQTWLVVLFAIVGPSYQELTKQDIAAIDNETLWQALLHHSGCSHPTTTTNTTTSINNSSSSTGTRKNHKSATKTTTTTTKSPSSVTTTSGPTFDVGLQKCHGCDRVEEKRGDFDDECSKCLSVVYCSFECQKRHWKVHKKQCHRIAGGGKSISILPHKLWNTMTLSQLHVPTCPWLSA